MIKQEHQYKKKNEHGCFRSQLLTCTSEILMRLPWYPNRLKTKLLIRQPCSLITFFFYYVPILAQGPVSAPPIRFYRCLKGNMLIKYLF